MGRRSDQLSHTSQGTDVLFWCKVFNGPGSPMSNYTCDSRTLNECDMSQLREKGCSKK